MAVTDGDGATEPEGAPPTGAATDDTPGVERLLSLSDGVVAIALTLLVLQLVVPTIDEVTQGGKNDVTSAGALWHAMVDAHGGQFSAYIISFYVIGQFWLTHHRVFQTIRGHDEGLAWWNFAFLFTITLMPFTSELLGRFGNNPLAIDVFAANLLLASLATQGVVIFARRHKLLKDNVNHFDQRVGEFRAVLVATVILCSGAMAWITPTLAMFIWLLLLGIQPVAVALARRYPGRRAGAVSSA